MCGESFVLKSVLIYFFEVKMKTILWIFALTMVAMLWSCEGKRVEAVRADRPDTLVLAAGPDSLVAQIGAASTADRLQLVLK